METLFEHIFNRRVHRARHLCKKSVAEKCPSDGGCDVQMRPTRAQSKFKYARKCCGTYCITCKGHVSNVVEKIEEKDE